MIGLHADGHPSKGECYNEILERECVCVCVCYVSPWQPDMDVLEQSIDRSAAPRGAA